MTLRRQIIGAPANLPTVAARSARAILAGRSDLGGREIPPAVWKAMGARGLLGCGIPAAFGGGGAGYREILPALETFVRAGASPGLALSWMVHLVTAKVLVEGAADSRQKRDMLPAMAAGRATVSIALSEPGAGSDPRRISATAVRRRGTYILNGQKTWLTNGPLADWFVVFAVEGEQKGRKAFTAFIVPRETPGLTVLETPPLGFLRPSPHCAIRLDACPLPESAVLGRRGRAWEDLSKPFRIAEDTLLAGAVLGGLGRRLGQLIRALRDRGAKTGTDAMESIGKASAMLGAARRAALAAAAELDEGGWGASVERQLVELHLLERELQASIDGLAEGTGLEGPAGPGTVGDDVARLIDLGTHAARARQRKWGEILLNGKEMP